MLLIKPDAVFDGKERVITQQIESEGFYIAGRHASILSDATVKKYLERFSETTESLDEMKESLTGSPTIALLLTRLGAIAKLRAIVGPRDPAEGRKTQPRSLRAK